MNRIPPSTGAPTTIPITASAALALQAVALPGESNEACASRLIIAQIRAQTEEPSYEKSPLIDPVNPRGTLSNVIDVMDTLQAIDLKEQPNPFGVFLLLQTAENALRHAKAALDITAGDGATDAIGIKLHPQEVAVLCANASPYESVEAFAGRLVGEAIARMKVVTNED